MKKKFTEGQIAFALRQAESGIRVIEDCQKMGIAFYLENLGHATFEESQGISGRIITHWKRGIGAHTRITIRAERPG